MRPSTSDCGTCLIIFQSTHPLRDATFPVHRVQFKFTISIHAPLTGCDVFQPVQLDFLVLFQSTHPLRDATFCIDDTKDVDTQISIHAPLTGCDIHEVYYGYADRKFQSTHPLRDATKHMIKVNGNYINFNPRTPYGMRQKSFRAVKVVRPISIHAPLTGCDLCAYILCIDTFLFQSTHPLRDATCYKRD